MQRAHAGRGALLGMELHSHRPRPRARAAGKRSPSCALHAMHARRVGRTDRRSCSHSRRWRVARRRTADRRRRSSRVPADLRHALASSRVTRPANDAEPVALALVARVEEQLHAETDAERSAARRGSPHASPPRPGARRAAAARTRRRLAARARPCRAARAGSVFDLDFRAIALERLDQRVQIARPVVEDRHTHACTARAAP